MEIEPITYDIKGYLTKEDFENGYFAVVDSYYLKLEDAIDLAKSSLSKYEITKVVSSDYEVNEIFHRRYNLPD
jgi:predicted AlkP superfamily phosphohydrolase/phosphomutase